VVAHALSAEAFSPATPREHVPAKRRPIDHPGRLKWVQRIAEETAPYRERRARTLERIGAERARHGVWKRLSRKELAAGEVTTREGRVEPLAALVTREVETPSGRKRREWLVCAGSKPTPGVDLTVSEHAAEANRRWHDARAKGMRTHFDKVRECGLTSTVYVSCPSCGVQHEHGGGCDSRVMCVACRGRQNARKRREFLAARSVVLERAKAAGVTNGRRPGGAYSEKFLTLTIPHLASHRLTDRILLTFTAWPFFLRSLNEWLRSEGEDAKHVEWFRHFECEPGTDEQGHPHFHLWFFGPWLPAMPHNGLQLQRWWCEALDAAAGVLGIEAPHLAPQGLQLDVQGNVDRVEEELIKYLVKEVVGGGYVEPAWFARLFEVLDGRRVTQCSAGFRAAGREAAAERKCRECDAVVERFNVAVRPNPDPSKGNGCPNGCTRGTYSREGGCTYCKWSRAKMDRALSEAEPERFAGVAYRDGLIVRCNGTVPP